MDRNVTYSDYNVANVLKNMNYDLKQDILTNVSPPSLQYLTILRVAITIWENNLRTTDWTYFNSTSSEINYLKWKLQEKISDLEIPKGCKEALKKMIKFIADELEDFLTDQVHRFATFDEFKLCLNNICWTQQGTINTVKTITNFIENLNLNKYVKFELACNYCLEEKILYFEQCFEYYINLDAFHETNNKFHMVMFWILYINNNLKQFSRFTKGIPTFKYLLYWSICHRKQSAVQFIWEKFARETFKEQILEFVHIAILVRGFEVPFWFSSMRIRFYFLTQMNEIQIKEAGVLFHLYIIRMAHRFSRWRDGLDVSEYILEVIAKNNSLTSLKVIRSCCNENIVNLEQLQTIWDSFTILFRSSIEKYFLKIFEFIFDPNYMTENDFVLGKFVLRLGTPEDIKKAIYTLRTMYCFLFMIYEDPGYVDDFFYKILEPKEISLFKMEILENKSLDLWENFACLLEYKNMNRLLNKFCPADRVYEFKMKLPYRNNAHIIVILLERETEGYVNHLTPMIKFLIWCFDGKVKEMAKCSEILFNVEINLFKNAKEEFYEKFKNLIQREKWESVKRYWNFILFAFGKKITTPMNNFECFKKIIYFMYGERCITYGLNKIRLLLTVYIRPGKNELLNLGLLKINGNETLLTLSVDSLFLLKLGKGVNTKNLKSLLRWFKFVFVPNYLLKNGKEIQLQDHNFCGSKELIKHENHARKMYYLFKWFSPSDFAAKMLEINFNLVKNVKLQKKRYVMKKQLVNQR